MLLGRSSVVELEVRMRMFWSVVMGCVLAGCAVAGQEPGVVHAAAGHRSPVPGGCEESSDLNVGKIGCYLDVALPVGKMPAQVYWHVDEYSSARDARAAKTSGSAVTRAHGRIFLQTVNGNPQWTPNGGRRIARIGPFPAPQGVDLTARMMQATTPAGLTTRPHTHSGVEAWYMLEGVQCVETPGRFFQFPAGEGHWVQSGVPMQLFSAGEELRRSIVLVLHPSTEPWMSMTDWVPQGLCKNRTGSRI